MFKPELIFIIFLNFYCSGYIEIKLEFKKRISFSLT